MEGEGKRKRNGTGNGDLGSLTPKEGGSSFFFLKHSGLVVASKTYDKLTLMDQWTTVD